MDETQELGRWMNSRKQYEHNVNKFLDLQC